jgi:glycosyltransferase involved in cell wall biosynthesis
VVTTYNQSLFLGEALESVINQQGCTPEIILVDDGSDDDTGRVASAYADRVRIIRIPHSGVATARNIGWRTSSCDLVAFLDGDDVWLPNKLAMEVAALDKQPNAGLVYSDTMRVRIDGTPIDRWSLHMPPVSGEALIPMLRQNRVQTSTVVMRRKVLEELNGFDETLAVWEDIDLWTRSAALHPFAYVPRVLAQYRMHGRGISLLAMGLAQGRLTSTERLLRRVGPERVPERERRAIIADARAQLGVAYYLAAKMAPARRCLLDSWRRDPWALARNRSVGTFVKSLAGPRLVGSVRKQLRPTIAE